MAEVLSKAQTNVAYGSGDTRVVLAPGVNTVPDTIWDTLKADATYLRHEAAGFVAKLVDAVEGTEPKAAPVPAATPAANSRDKLAGESKAAYNARMAKLDEDEAAARFVTDYAAMTLEEKTAMYPALSDVEKELVGPLPTA